MRPTSAKLKANKPLTGFKPLAEDPKLFGKVLAQGSALLGLASNPGNLGGLHTKHGDWREDVSKLANELLFDDLNRDIVDEPLQRDLLNTLLLKSCKGVALSITRRPTTLYHMML